MLYSLRLELLFSLASSLLSSYVFCAKVLGSSLFLDGQIKVAQAVHVLNHGSQSCNRVAANQWLVQFQQTETAWEVATSILTSDGSSFLVDFEVKFFATQILKRKIQTEGYYFQLGAKDTLLNALLLAAKKFSLELPQGLPQVLLYRLPFLKEVWLLPALTTGDEKVIGGVACLISEIRQAVIEQSSKWSWRLLHDFYFVFSFLRVLHDAVNCD